MNRKTHPERQTYEKVGNHPNTKMISKPVIINSREEHSCRKWELHLKLRNQQLKRTLYIYIKLIKIPIYGG